MDILPKFVEWSKQGEVGHRKLNQATHYISLVLAFIQSVGLQQALILLNISVTTPNVAYILIGALLTTGSMI